MLITVIHEGKKRAECRLAAKNYDMNYTKLSLFIILVKVSQWSIKLIV